MNCKRTIGGVVLGDYTGPNSHIQTDFIACYTLIPVSSAVSSKPVTTKNNYCNSHMPSAPDHLEEKTKQNAPLILSKLIMYSTAHAHTIEKLTQKRKDVDAPCSTK